MKSPQSAAAGGILTVSSFTFVSLIFTTLLCRFECFSLRKLGLVDGRYSGNSLFFIYLMPHALHKVPGPSGPTRHCGVSVLSQWRHALSVRRLLVGRAPPPPATTVRSSSLFPPLPLRLLLSRDEGKIGMSIDHTRFPRFADLSRFFLGTKSRAGAGAGEDDSVSRVLDVVVHEVSDSAACTGSHGAPLSEQVLSRSL